MKRVIAITVCVLVLISLLSVSALAATASASLTGPGTVRAGDTITLNFNLNGTGLYGASGTLSYDSNLLELKGTAQKIGNGWAVEFNGNNFVAYDNNLAKPVNSNTTLFSVSFKVKNTVAAGAVIKVSYNSVTATDGNQDSDIGTVTYSATIAAPASTDNTLKSLTVSNATISPAFSTGTTSYTAEVPFSVSKLDVKAVANDSKAKVSVNSPTLTPGGTTNVTITVTAENGSTKTYTIAVKREQDPNYVASSNNDLSSITVNGFLLSPAFSADNTRYVIWLPYETDSVTVSGTAADNKANVTVEGGSGLVAGADNEIKVICTAEDGTEKVYIIIAKRAPSHDGGDVPTDPTEPPVEPTEPPADPTEPTENVPPTEPGNDPIEPTSSPAEQQKPVDSEKTGGVSAIVLLIACVACLAIGAFAGILIGKKKK